MKFFSITGPKEDIDRVVDNYLSRYEIHLENALNELKEVQGLSAFVEENPYKTYLEKANRINNLINHNDELNPKDLSLEEAIELVDRLDALCCISDEALAKLRDRETRLEEAIETIEPYRQIPYDLSSLLDFKFIHYRFGRIPKEYYKKFHDYVYENEETFFFECSQNDDFVWGVYFVPLTSKSKIDAMFSSLHFERNFIPDQYNGTPEEAYEELMKEKNHLMANVEASKKIFLDEMNGDAEVILGAKKVFETVVTNFDVRKLAAATDSGKNKSEFYIICGWISVKDMNKLKDEVEQDDLVFLITEREEENISSKPPTKLKNPGIVKPFEMFTEMYGLPAYNEIDPTPLIAITYSFIFGAMFGDLGQGICLLILGALIYKFKKIKLGAILVSAGVFSSIFGLLFGSVFGFENWIDAIWLRPIESMTQLPVVGSMNSVFVYAIGFGMVLIIGAMVLNIINGFRSKDYENALLDKSSIAGLVFYGSLFTVLLLFITGKSLPAKVVLLVMFIIPLILIVIKEPLVRIIKKEEHIFEDGIGMFLTQQFFELFEVLLSYFSNTLSFVRIGAFAVSHAAMMEVVLMLANIESGHPNILVVIIGNIFVMGLEGLIVGIQVLRLEYYEMFSRFYHGTGKKFISSLRGRNTSS